MYGHLNKKETLEVLMFLLNGIIKRNMKKIMSKWMIKKLIKIKILLFIKDIIIYLKKMN